MCRQLATSYDAGIPIVKGLQLASQHASTPRVRAMLSNMAENILDGASLSEAARTHRAALPDFFVEVVSAGEIGGRLDALLKDLADYYENMHEVQRFAAVSMVYPLLQLSAAWFLGFFSLGLVRRLNPMASERFNLAAYFREYLGFQAIALTIIALLFIALVIAVRCGLLRAPGALIKNYVWPIRQISQKFALARFFRSMALLIGAGLDIRKCIERSAAVTMNPQIENDLLRAIPVVTQGGTLVEAFAGCRRISRVGREMIAVGEQSGNLEHTLKKVAEYHLSEAQAAVRAATTIMRVLVLLAVGAIVAVIVISFYGNLYGSMLSF